MTIAIEIVTAAEIEAFSADPERNLAADGSLVIYPLRAAALAHNSDTRPDDPVLLLAVHRGRCVGYLALLWDRLRWSGSDYRWIWGNQFYVAPEYRRLPCALLLIREAISLADGWGAWGIAPGAERICRALGGWQPSRVTGFEASSLAAVGDRLRNRLPLAARLFQPLVGLAERPARRWAERLLAQLEVSMAQSPEGVSGLVVPDDRAGDGPHFHRTKARIEWILGFPWASRREPGSEGFWTTRPYPWTRARQRHEFELQTLDCPDFDRRGYVLLCHSQRDRRDSSRTFLVDWSCHRPAGSSFEIAVAAAMAAHLEAGTDRLEIHAASRFLAAADAIPGLHRSRSQPVFLACCARDSKLRRAGLHRLPVDAWYLTGAEGDQQPLLT